MLELFFSFIPNHPTLKMRRKTCTGIKEEKKQSLEERMREAAVVERKEQSK